MHLFFIRNKLKITLVTVVVFSFAFNVQAQDVGVSIAPAVVEDVIEPGTQKTYSLSVQNLSQIDQTYYLYVRNISTLAPGGGPIFASPSSEQTGYELAHWIQLPVEQINLTSLASERVQFTVTVPQSVSPGSYLGSAFLSVHPPEMLESGLAVGYQVANIIHIRVPGDVFGSANIQTFLTRSYFNQTQDIDFEVEIQNSSDVLIRPIGPIEIYNMLGEKVGNVTFNEQRFAVLPHSDREYLRVNWLGNKSGFGRYEAVLSVSYGDPGAYQTTSKMITFWILPLRIIVPALSILILILLAMGIPTIIHHRRSADQLNQERRLVQRRRDGRLGKLLFYVIILTGIIGLFFTVLLWLFA